MKKNFIAIVAFILAIHTSYAQFSEELRFGLKAGLNAANISGDDVDGGILFGHHIGGFLEIPFNEKLVFVPEIMFSVQGFNNSESISMEVLGNTITASFEERLRLNYFNIPLLIRFNINESFFVEGGPQIGFLSTANYKVTGDSSISGNIGGEDFNFDAEEIDNPGTLNVRDQFANLDYGFTGGLGAHFNDSIGMSVRYYLGLNDITNSSIPSAGLRNSLIMASFFYRF